MRAAAIGAAAIVVLLLVLGCLSCLGLGLESVGPRVVATLTTVGTAAFSYAVGARAGVDLDRRRWPAPARCRQGARRPLGARAAARAARHLGVGRMLGRRQG